MSAFEPGIDLNDDTIASCCDDTPLWSAPLKALLEHFTKAECRGCRAGDCAYPNCGVVACYKGKGVDFCFQCGEFPREKTNFDDNLKARWIAMNTRMKEIGVERCFEESRNAPRYVL